MIPVKFVHDSVTKDLANLVEYGNLTFDMYRRCSRRGELRLVDYMTDDVEGPRPPKMYTSQKLKDWVAPLIERTTPRNVSPDGMFEKPANYYRHENTFLIGNPSVEGDCENSDVPLNDIAGVTVDIVDNAEFYSRVNSPIIGLAPTRENPIGKMIGNKIEFAPRDIGMVSMEYVRYPKFANIVTKIDDLYKQEVLDEDASTDYEYSEFAAELLIYFIIDSFAFYTRDSELLAINKSVGKLVRDEK